MDVSSNLGLHEPDPQGTARVLWVSAEFTLMTRDSTSRNELIFSITFSRMARRPDLTHQGDDRGSENQCGQFLSVVVEFKVKMAPGLERRLWQPGCLEHKTMNAARPLMRMTILDRQGFSDETQGLFASVDENPQVNRAVQRQRKEGGLVRGGGHVEGVPCPLVGGGGGLGGGV